VFGGVLTMPSIYTSFTQNSLYDDNVGLRRFNNILGLHILVDDFTHRVVYPSPVAFKGRATWDPQTEFCLTFQFVWYEIISISGVELGRESGNLYRDSKERKLQKQSYLVSHSRGRVLYSHSH
jgi:hypothetical protein